MEDKIQNRDEIEEKRGRPEKYTVDYFPHNVNHNEDLWVKRISRKYGNNGYAIYYKLLEILGGSKNHYIDISEEDEKLFFEEEMYNCESKEVYKILDYSSFAGKYSLIICENIQLIRLGKWL
jgi:hypothetical protein